MNKVLVVDDEANVLAAFERLLSVQGYAIVAARSGEAALALLDRERADVVVLDVCMPGMNGLDLLARIKELHPRLPVIVMTGQGTMDTAIEATKRGAFDYQLKPFDPEGMLRIVDRALAGARIMDREVALDPIDSNPAGDAIIGQSQAMQVVYKAIGRVAATNASVLIRGESGTGKELVARAVYQHSQRNTTPMHIVNCVAIPEALLEAELFGHERGSFTGAHLRRIGQLEQADRGTVFLDEIGDIPLGVQGKLLRVLQERTLQRVGGNEAIQVDVRILAATNRNLEEAITAGSFREDLYHRLNVVTIRLPPLRDRREDIPRLAKFFLDRFARELQLPKPQLADDAMALIEGHSWPGNVRELEHCIHRTLIFTGDHAIQADDLRAALADSAPDGAAPGTSDEAIQALARSYLSTYRGPQAHERLVDRLERCLLHEALERTHGNVAHAARLLGLPRATLYGKVQKFGLGDANDEKP